jgi:hypothetical protein
MRRPLVLVLAVCLAVPAVALGAAGDPVERFTARDQAVARSLTLKRTDLSAGWKATKPSDDGGDLTCPGFDPNLSDLTLTGEAETEFEHPSVAFIGSSVSVFRTSAQAQAAWSRVVRPALLRCLVHFFREGVAESGGTVKVTRRAKVAFPKVAPRVAAYRITAAVGSKGAAATVPFALDLVLLGRGRAEVAVLAMAPGRGVAPADLRTFGKLLAGRLQKAGV